MFPGSALKSSASVIASLAISSWLLLGGCAAKQTVAVWEKPGASAGELEAARSECQKSVGDIHSGSTRIESEVRGNAFVHCMQEKGWSWRTEEKN